MLTFTDTIEPGLLPHRGGWRQRRAASAPGGVFRRQRRAEKRRSQPPPPGRLAALQRPLTQDHGSGEGSGAPKRQVELWHYIRGAAGRRVLPLALQKVVRSSGNGRRARVLRHRCIRIRRLPFIHPGLQNHPATRVRARPIQAATRLLRVLGHGLCTAGAAHALQ